jgi:hypothetical protein
VGFKSRPIALGAEYRNNYSVGVCGGPRTRLGVWRRDKSLVLAQKSEHNPSDCVRDLVTAKCSDKIL